MAENQKEANIRNTYSLYFYTIQRPKQKCEYCKNLMKNIISSKLWNTNIEILSKIYKEKTFSNTKQALPTYTQYITHFSNESPEFPQNFFR